jgi:uncharacterized protein YuzE
MKVKYFPDTDTAFIEFKESEIFETREISENVYINVDQQGNIVNMSIEHANSNAGLKEFSYQEITRKVA